MIPPCTGICDCSHAIGQAPDACLFPVGISRPFLSRRLSHSG
ncbi:hypothetical protein [Dysgonomonas macrotermitis]|nr:hypothetical protein [Dysgonomonas macrotermitis]